MAQITRSVVLDASPDQVWAVIGGFQDLAKWHPAIAACKRDDIRGVEHRRLTLAGGGDILERNLGSDGLSYGYAIEKSPLPMTDYRAVISVSDAGGKALVTWCSTFEPGDASVAGVVVGVYEAGLNALKKRFGA